MRQKSRNLKEYLKERWGIVLVHLIISIVAFSAHQLESFSA